LRVALSWTFAIPEDCTGCLGYTDSTSGKQKREVHRYSSSGSNPACHTNEYFTPLRTYYEVELVKLGSWVSIGLATDEFITSNGNVVGGQADIINYGNYEDGGRCSFYFNGQEEQIPDQNKFRLKAGMKIGVLVKHKTGTQYSVKFYCDGNKTQEYEFTYTNKPLRPTIGLGSGTTVKLLFVPARQQQ